MAWERISAKYEKGKIPKELKPFLVENCPQCGKPRIGNDELTEVKCIDYNCVRYVKNRAVDMFKYLGVEGLGPASCEKLLYTHKAKSHMELIPIKFGDKPNVHLWEVAKLAAVPGYSGSFKELLEGYSTFEEYFATAENIPPMVKTFESRLLQYEDYFKLKPALSKNKIIVMITGHVTGFANKDLYVAHCNKLFGHIVQTDMKKSVKAKFVITEHPDSDTDKLKKARDNKIPVITPNQYMVFLLSKMNPSNKELTRIVTEIGKERQNSGGTN